MEKTVRQKIVMSGASGFVGFNLIRVLQAENCEVLPLGRKDFALVPEALAERIEGADTIINLAGRTGYQKMD